MMRHFWRALACAGALGALPCAYASEPLRLEQAVSRVLASSPSLASEVAQLDAIQSKADRESLPPPFMVITDLENVAGTGNLSGTQSAEATLRIARLIELGGKRAARRAVGNAEVVQQRGRVDAARLDIAAQTAKRFIAVAVDQQRLAFAAQRQEQAQRTRREVASWVSAGRNPESDLSAADIALANAELDLEHAEHELRSSRIALSVLWGDTLPDFDSVLANLDRLPDLAPFEALASRLTHSIDQTLWQQEAASIAARRGLAEAKRLPDLDVSLGIRHLEGTREQGLVMAIAVPLGTAKRAALSVNEASAQLAAIEARRQVEQFERHQTVYATYQEIAHARTEIESLRGRVIPKAEQALQFTRRGFEAGRFSYFALSQAQQTVFDLRERLVEAYARYHTLLVEVDRLTANAEDAAS